MMLRTELKLHMMLKGLNTKTDILKQTVGHQKYRKKNHPE